LHDNNAARVSENLHPGRSFQKAFVILNMCTHSYVLYVSYVSLSLGEECISRKGKWFTPSMFEKFGGKGHHKKWKGSIYYKPSNGLQQVKLLKLIQTTDEAAAAQLNFSDSPTDLNFSDFPTDATEPAVSPIVEEANQTTDEAAAAAQLNFSGSPAERQNPVASEETEKTGQMQLIKFLEKQFNTMNNTLKSIDLSLKKLSINILLLLLLLLDNYYTSLF
uniref:Zgc:171506 n=1 Tax=Sinocyclocheilus anshuiensis TaxID=1608454 RepID=A0A671NXA0_9TELE